MSCSTGRYILPFSSILEMHVLEMEANYTVLSSHKTHFSAMSRIFFLAEISFASRKLMSLIYLVLFFVLSEIGTHFKSHWKNKPFTFQKCFIWSREVIFLHNICQYVSLECRNKLKALLKISLKIEVQIPNMKLTTSPSWKFC